MDKRQEYGKFCDVCYLEFPVNEFYDLGCGHSYCMDCTREHLATKIKAGRTIDIPCMVGKEICKKTFSLA